MPRTLGALLPLLLTATLLAGCGGDDEATDTTTTSPPTTAEDGTTTTTEPDQIEDVAVVVDGDGRVVVIDASTGDEVRVLLEGVPVDDPAKNDVAVALQGDDVFVVRPAEGARTAAGAEIVRVPLAGGDPEVVAEGLTPAVSPDGSTLAYVALVEGLTPEPVLVLRDLETGDERRLAREEEDRYHFVGDVAWSADGSEVVFSAGEINMGLYAVARSATTLDDARRIGPETRGEDVSWREATALGPDRLAVVETCCDIPQRERWLVVAVNLAEEVVEGGLLPEERVEATHLDSDRDGERLLIVAGGGPGGGELLRWDGEGALEQVTTGIVVAAW